MFITKGHFTYCTIDHTVERFLITLRITFCSIINLLARLIDTIAYHTILLKQQATKNTTSQQNTVFAVLHLLLLSSFMALVMIVPVISRWTLC